MCEGIFDSDEYLGTHVVAELFARKYCTNDDVPYYSNVSEFAVAFFKNEGKEEYFRGRLPKSELIRGHHIARISDTVEGLDGMVVCYRKYEKLPVFPSVVVEYSGISVENPESLPDTLICGFLRDDLRHTLGRMTWKVGATIISQGIINRSLGSVWVNRFLKDKTFNTESALHSLPEVPMRMENGDSVLGHIPSTPVRVRVPLKYLLTNQDKLNRSHCVRALELENVSVNDVAYSRILIALTNPYENFKIRGNEDTIANCMLLPKNVMRMLSAVAWMRVSVAQTA